MSAETRNPGQHSPQDVNDKSKDPSQGRNPNPDPAQGQHRPNDPSQERKRNEHEIDQTSDKRKAS